MTTTQVALKFDKDEIIEEPRVDQNGKQWGKNTPTALQLGHGETGGVYEEDYQNTKYLG